jgi:hypothetical protein
MLSIWLVPALRSRASAFQIIAKSLDPRMESCMNNHNALRLALRLNAGFSTLCAVAILFMHGTLVELMGVASPILWAVSAGLAGFACHLVFTAARSDAAKLRAESLRHSISDVAWVAGSVGVMLWGVLTPAGNWVLAAVAVPVLTLGIAQWRALPAANSESLAVEA